MGCALPSESVPSPTHQCVNRHSPRATASTPPSPPSPLFPSSSARLVLIIAADVTRIARLRWPTPQAHATSTAVISTSHATRATPLELEPCSGPYHLRYILLCIHSGLLLCVPLPPFALAPRSLSDSLHSHRASNVAARACPSRRHTHTHSLSIYLSPLPSRA